MKYIKQVLIIIGVSFLGELLNFLFPFPIPGSIYGMVILFALLSKGVIKVSQVKEVGDFLIDIMPLLFIPSAVGIMSQWNNLKFIWLEIIIITIVTTFVVMGVTGLVTQMLIRIKEQRKERK